MKLTPEQVVFVTERRLATLTTLRPDGSPHVVPVAYVWDAFREVIMIRTEAASVKARNAAQGQGAQQGQEQGAPSGQRGDSERDPLAVNAALCQVDDGRWLTFEGAIAVSDDPQDIAWARRAHLRRYGHLTFGPPDDAAQVVLILTPRRILGSDYMVS